MTVSRKDRVLDQSSTLVGAAVSVLMDGVTETGALAVLQAFPSNQANIRLTITNPGTAEWEVVDGPWSASTQTFTRTTVRANSAGGTGSSFLTFSTGTKKVMAAPVVYDLDHVDALDGTIAGQTILGGIAGAESLRVMAVASAVNRLEVSGSVTGSDLLIAANGADANVSINLVPRGTGTVKLTGQSISLGGGLATAGALSTAAAFTTAGAFALTLTATAATNVTLPVTGTLATLAGAETLSNKTLAAPVIGVATGTSLAATGAITSSGTAGVGYATGAGGTVTQATSKTTGVTLNKITGQITMNGAALAAGIVAQFTLTNSTIAATDMVLVQHCSGGSPGQYTCEAYPAAGSATINVRNAGAGSLSEAIVLQFIVIKAVTA